MTKDEKIILSVKLSDGSFDTEVSLPVSANKEQREKVVEAWFNLIHQALGLCSDENPNP